MRYLVILLFGLFGAMSVLASAAEKSAMQCQSGGSTPDLSFSIFVWNSWDADRCQSQLELAREMGFTALTWVPTYGWNQANQTIIPNPAMNEATSRCLGFAWEQGFQVYFKPHFENFDCWNDPTRSETGACWRAWLKHQPGLEETRWGHFLNPLHELIQTRKKLGLSSNLKFLLGAEMERSLSNEASSWLNMARTLKKEWGASINSNPNWQPFCNVPKEQCLSLKAFLLEADGFQPSIYGDFFNNSVSQKIDNMVDEWADRINCSNTENEKTENKKLLSAKVSVGEVGIGPSLIESEEWIFDRIEPIFKAGYPYSDLAEYLDLRKGVYTQWLTWARNRQLPAGGVFNIWPGAQDPVGFSAGGVVDARLIETFRTYTQERCGSGVQFKKSVSEVVAESAHLFPDLNERKTRLNQIQGSKSPHFPPLDGRTNESRKRDLMDHFCRK